MNEYFSLGEAARLLGVAHYRITYGHTTGRFPEPARVLGKRAYRWKDLTLLAKHFGVRLLEPASVPEKEEHE